MAGFSQLHQEAETVYLAMMLLDSLAAAVADWLSVGVVMVASMGP